MEILEELLPGKLKIWQKKKGARFTTDAILLSALVHVEEGEHVLEIGTGTGVVAMLLSYVKKAYVTAVEIQQEYAQLAERSVQLNGLGERIRIVHGDIRTFEPAQRSYEHIVCNPPFYPARTKGLYSVYLERTAARSEQFLSLYELVHAVDRLLSAKGRFSMIYPSGRREELMDAMKKMGFQLNERVDIHPRENQPSSRFFSVWTREGVRKIQHSCLFLRNGSEETKQLKEIYRSLGYEKEPS